MPVYAQLCGRLELKDVDVLTAYTFTVLENQVLAAVKTVPLGKWQDKEFYGICMGEYHKL